MKASQLCWYLIRAHFFPHGCFSVYDALRNLLCHLAVIHDNWGVDRSWLKREASVGTLSFCMHYFCPLDYQRASRGSDQAFYGVKIANCSAHSATACRHPAGAASPRAAENAAKPGARHPSRGARRGNGDAIAVDKDSRRREHHQRRRRCNLTSAAIPPNGRRHSLLPHTHAAASVPGCGGRLPTQPPEASRHQERFEDAACRQSAGIVPPST